jgi:hypothetical protein
LEPKTAGYAQTQPFLFSRLKLFRGQKYSHSAKRNTSWLYLQEEEGDEKEEEGEEVEEFEEVEEVVHSC